MIRLFAHLATLFFEAIWSALDAPLIGRDRDRILSSLARRLGGIHKSERRDYNGAVIWSLDETQAVLYFLENSRGRVEGVTLRLRKACSFRLRLFPETGWARVRRFFGAQDVQTGDAALDRAYMVQTDRVANARSVLTRDVRMAIFALGRFAPLSLEMGPNGIVLRTAQGSMERFDRLVAFTGDALALARAILQVLDPSVIAGEMELQGPGSCPVCSTPVEEDRAVCSRCRTPHHGDCWKYLGGCAVYACAGRPRRMRVLRGRRPVRAA